MNKWRLKRKISTLMLVLAIACGTGKIVNAAPLSYQPVKLTQPNGDVIQCYTSGDEFFNYYHDAQGKIITKDPKTGYYTYGKQVNDKVEPTEYKITAYDMQRVNYKGLNSDELNKPDIKIPVEEIKKAKNAMFPKQFQPMLQNVSQRNGKINNIVIFIKFSDQEDFQNFNSYDERFNSTRQGVNSLRNYFRESSYNKLDIETTFYPKPQGNIILTYTDPHPRSYYANPGNERAHREQTLVKNAIEYVKNQIPKDLNLDFDNDGKVDNICFIVKGQPEGWSSLLWPHMWSLYKYYEQINGKKVWNYNFQLESMTNVSTLSHEMLHTLGTPDLYSYTYRSDTPVGAWDIMASTGRTPQQMGAYMKYKYGKWINEIPEINRSGRYTLKPVTSSENNCYKIQLPEKSDEYFMVEFRNRKNFFDGSIPGTGLIIYRVNTRYNGVNGGGDEIYVYRKDGTFTNNGSLWDANLSDKAGRNSFGGPTNPIFYSNGADSGLLIENVVVSGDTVSFDVKIPGDDFEDEIEEEETKEEEIEEDEIEEEETKEDETNEDEVYLSDLNCKKAKTSWSTVKKDRSIDRNIIKVGGNKYDKGIGTHANSEIVYELNGKYDRFISKVGVDDEVGANGSVIFKVYGDKEILFNSGIMKGKDSEKEVKVYVKGFQQLKLVVENGDDGISYDHADWADAKLISSDSDDSDESNDTEISLMELNWRKAKTSWGKIQKNKSIDKQSITIDRKVYDKGIGTHADSEIVYELNGEYKRFKCLVGIDDETDNLGSVVFKVYGDGEILFDSGITTGRDKGKNVDVNITGINELKLVVNDGGDNKNWDHADWAQPVLIK